MPAFMSSHPKYSGGFDAAIDDPANDHLNRWPLAQQIYNVAANGPIDWCVRIGVYGEWGTGKTSVLKFVESMARKDDHIVVWFDPWEYTDQTKMWRAYVEEVYQQAEAKLGKLKEADAVRLKKLKQYISQTLEAIVKLSSSNAADVAKDGFSLVKKHLSAGAEDLLELRNVLNGKRVFVFIDDLDRTASELVPEILYALKEVMDIPAFAFVCGFDPSVVGKVLGDKHPGFGDGLKFLEKIIDYPVWLPPTQQDGLVKIALADAKRHCPFVPEDALKEVLPDLPQNPRAIRQFIRLLSLLGVQTNRYYEHELRWSVILSATALKVHYPKTADDLLLNRSLWEALSIMDYMITERWGKSESTEKIRTHIKEVFESQNQSLRGEDEDIIGRILHRTGKALGFWNSADVDLIFSQITITEQPQAVTWKEFDQLLANLDFANLQESLKTWIADHALAQHHREADVATELCMAAVDRYCDELRKADTGFEKHTESQHQKNAETVFKVLETLTLGMGEVLPSLQSKQWLPVKQLFSKLADLASATSPVHCGMWPHTESFLISLAQDQDIDLEGIRATCREIHRDMDSGPMRKKLVQQLDEILIQHLCRAAAHGIKMENFIANALDGSTDYATLSTVILNSQARSCAEYRSSALNTFKSESSNPNVRMNAYMIIDWLAKMSFNTHPGMQRTAIPLLRDEEMISLIWAAATSVQFSGKRAHALREFPNLLAEQGINIKKPAWWDSSIKEHDAFIQNLTPPATVPAPVDDAALVPAENMES